MSSPLQPVNPAAFQGTSSRKIEHVQVHMEQLAREDMLRTYYSASVFEVSKEAGCNPEIVLVGTSFAPGISF